MEIGKLSHNELKNIVFEQLSLFSDRVVKGSGTGIDCAIWRAGEGLICISSDPVTGAGTDIGKIAIHVSCNDIACCGIKPEVILLVIIAPPSSTPDELRRIVKAAADTADAIGVEVVGGHTEISDSVNQFVLITTAFGYAKNQKVVNSSGAKVRDTLLMTKYAAMEGTSIVASDYLHQIVNFLESKEIEDAQNLVDQISVVKEGVLCGKAGVHAMHDITEGGVLGAAWEMSEASKVGCTIDLSYVPVLSVTRKISDHLHLDPYRFISSGSMLIATDQPNEIKKILKNNGILCTAIGEIVENRREYLDLYGEKHELSEPNADELYKLKKKY
jgi:hydrogenase expression/formation protein HypE